MLRTRCGHLDVVSNPLLVLPSEHLHAISIMMLLSQTQQATERKKMLITSSVHTIKVYSEDVENTRELTINFKQPPENCIPKSCGLNWKKGIGAVVK